MRLGVFGGTFDPVHLGHLIVAEQAREQARLDHVLFVPAARPPHKDEPDTPFERRSEMLALAISGQPAFRIDETEKDRPGPSYTVDTLAEIQRVYAGAELFLLIGADMVQYFPQWYQPRRVLELATLLVVGRPGWELPDRDEMAARLDLPAGVPLRWQRVQTPLIEIASRDLRRRVAAGRSIRYLVPRGVEAYIEDKRLYRAG